MIKNNALTIFFHLLISFLCFAFIWFGRESDFSVRFLFGTPAGKVLLILLIFAVYQIFGKLLSTRGLADVITSSLGIIFLNLVLIGLAYMGLGRDFFTMEPAQSLRNLPYTLFNMPYLALIKSWKLPMNKITIGLSVLFAPLLFSLSQGLYLRKKNKRRRKKERTQDQIEDTRWRRR